MKLIIAAFIILLASAVSAEEAQYSIEEDLAFGDLPRLKLDIFTPSEVRQDAHVLVFLYGGGFSRGSKASVRRLAQSLSAAGQIVVTPNYRLHPETSFPGFVEDAAAAIAYVWRNVRDENGNPRPIVIGGWSAGAYIAALVAYDDRYLHAVQIPRDSIKGFVGLAGPYRGGLCAGRACPTVFPNETRSDWSVASFVDANDPPMLLVRGTRDNFVDKSNLSVLAASGRAAGIDVTTLAIKGAFHEDLLSRMAKPEAVVRKSVDDFIRNLSHN